MGAIGNHGRTGAKEAVCRSHLRQWASVFDSAMLDNDGYFPSRSVADGAWWIEALWAYHQDEGLLVCPAATKASSDVLPTHRAWRAAKRVGSYGVNGSVGRLKEDTYRMALGRWQTPRVWDAEKIPLFGDMCWTNAWPNPSDFPPFSEQSIYELSGGEMRLVCVNRHDGSINLLFMDGSVRKVGLKELWTLKWSMSYNTEGPWTIVGGVPPTAWPEWMRQFKDF